MNQQLQKQRVPELRFPEFEGKWEEKKLGQISKFLDSKRIPLSQAERAKRQGYYPYYGASGIIDYIDDYIFDGTYILLGEDGANILNRSTRLAFIVHGKIWVNNHAHIIKANGSDYFLSEALERIRYEKYNTGTAQPKLNAEVCKKIKLYLPPLPEQQKIADFLTTIDTRIQQLSQKVELLEDYKKGVMQQIFSQEIRFRDDEGNKFPDWKEQKVRDFLIERNIKAPKSDRFPLMSFVAHIGVTPKGRRYDRSFLVKDRDEKKYKQTKYGDFIYSSNNLETGSIGLNLYGSACISPVYSIFQVRELCDYRFIGSFLVRKVFLHKMIRFRQGVVYGQWRIHESDFLQIKEKIPSLKEQQKIADFLDAVNQKINLTKRQLNHLQSYKKGLLQQMFV